MRNPDLVATKKADRGAEAVYDGSVRTMPFQVIPKLLLNASTQTNDYMAWSGPVDSRQELGIANVAGIITRRNITMRFGNRVSIGLEPAQVPRQGNCRWHHPKTRSGALKLGPSE